MAENLYTFTVAELPSKGVAYNFNSISAKPMTVGQVKALRNALNTESETDVSLAINRVLDGCMSVKSDLITLGDKLALALWVRVETLGKNFVCNFTCPECGKVIENYNIDLTSLQYDYIADGYKGPVKVKDGKNEVEISMFMIADEVECLGYCRNKSLTEEDVLNIRLSATIRKINGKNVRFSEKLSFFESLPEGSKIADFLRKFHLYFAHGLNRTVKMQCSQKGCEKETELMLPFRGDLFISPGISDDDFREAILSQQSDEQPSVGK